MMDKELRANWVAHDSIIDTEGRQSMLGRMLEARLNTVFISVPPVNGNYGDGNTEHFTDFVQLCKEQDLVVFGWIANHKRTHPTPADLRLPEERKAQAQWVRDIINTFPCLDGIAIDYIRYPTWEESDTEKQSGVSLTVDRIRKVTDEAGVTLLTTCFPAATVTFRGSNDVWQEGVPPWFQEWYSANPSNYFKREALSGGTGLVNQNNLGNVPNPTFLLGPSFMSYQQDPVKWLRDGFVDNVIPMQYTSDPVVMRNDIDLWVQWMEFINQPINNIYLGLGWMDEPSSFPDSKFDPVAMIDHIKYGLEQGVGGFTIFRMGIPGIDDALLIQALTQPSYRNSWAPPITEYKASPFEDLQRSCQVPTTGNKTTLNIMTPSSKPSLKPSLQATPYESLLEPLPKFPPRPSLDSTPQLGLLDTVFKSPQIAPIVPVIAVPLASNASVPNCFMIMHLGMIMLFFHFIS